MNDIEKPLIQQCSIFFFFSSLLLFDKLHIYIVVNINESQTVAGMQLAEWLYL